MAAPLRPWTAPLLIAALCIAIFRTTLINSHLLIAQTGEDVTNHLLWWRSFGFDALRHGHFPFWDPHLAGGVPYFGPFQSAMLYPLNWIFLLLPIPLAINCSFALHTFLSGFFMQLWTRSKGLSTVASLLAGAMYMLGGMTWLRVYAGHHMAVCSMPWIPLIFWSIDGLLRNGRWQWCLLGAGAIAMQILAGFPQFIYFTAIAAGLYWLLSWSRNTFNCRAFLGIVVIYAIGSGIAAVQVLAAAGANSQGPRASGLDYQTASAGAFVPADALTLFCPLLFGDGTSIRNYAPGGLGESSLFIGTAGVALAILGLHAAPARLRRICVGMVVLMFILALGHYTPLYWPLYRFMPLFGSFRDVGRFNLFIGLFVCVLAAAGFDRLTDGSGTRWKWSAIAPLCIGLLLLIAASRAGEHWIDWLDHLDPSGFSHAHLISKTATVTPALAAHWAMMSLLTGGITLSLTSLLLLIAHRWSAMLIATLLVIELLTFANRTRPTVTMPLPYPAQWTRYLARAGASRITYCTGSSQFTDRPMLDGSFEANIYDQSQLTRYKTLFDFAGGFSADPLPPPNLAVCRRAFTLHPALWALLRLRYVFVGNHAHSVLTLPKPMQQVQLVHRVNVVGPQSNQILAAMADPTFDPRQTAILESPSSITIPESSAGGSVRIVRQTDNDIELRANLPTPALLLITDSYSPGWSAIAFKGSAQNSYDIVPADLAMRGIAMSAGQHHLLLRYRPPSLRIGIIISAISLLIYAVGAIIGLAGLRDIFP